MKKFFKGVLFFALLGTAVFAQAESYHVVGAHFPPWMYEHGDSITGFYVELLQMMVDDMPEVEISIKLYPVPRMLAMLSEDTHTFSLGITRNEKREDLYKWVGPIYPRIFALFKHTGREDLSIHDLEDLQPYRIGVGRGYAAVDDLLKAGVPREHIDEVTVDSQNIRKLFRNRIDFAVANDMVFAYLLKQAGHRWNEVEQTLILNDRYEFYYAFNQGMDDRIIQQFQHCLDQIKQDGRYAALVNQYFY